MDHFFFFLDLVIGVWVLGLDGDGTMVDSILLFLLKSAFKNKKKCFNRYFLLWVKC
jgi:hypothetical protein